MSQPKRKPHPDLVATMRVVRSQPEAEGIRLACMNGVSAQRYEANAKLPTGSVLNPPVGEFCTAVLENSADVERDKARFAATPDQSLVAPHFAIGVSRGLPETRKTAIDVIRTFTSAARGSQSMAPLKPSMPGGPELFLTQGVALDAGFTRTTLMNMDKPTAEAPTQTPEELYSKADACFRNVGITVGECLVVGEQLALNYLAPKIGSTARAK